MQTIISLLFSIFIFCFSQITGAAVYNIQPGSDIIGQLMIITSQKGDTLNSIAASYDLTLNEIKHANNHLQTNTLTPGSQVVIPTRFILPPYRQGIVINIPELRLYYFPTEGDVVYTFPVSLGREGWRTPTLKSWVVKKEQAPTWHVPQSIREYMYEKHGRLLPDQIPPGPDNPLGDYAFYLGKKGYLIHGTNTPSQIGQFISSGCIRMHNKDIAKLFELAGAGTVVRIINHAYKAGWRDGKLFLEAHNPIELVENQNILEVDESAQEFNQSSPTTVIEKAYERAPTSVSVDWQRAHAVIEQKQGIPVIITGNW